MTQLALIPQPPTVTSPDSNEWYTPRHIVEIARRVMGGIDLDPFSCPQANEIVQADKYYTKEQDGLSLPWHGRIWCNPPYSRDLIGPAFERLHWHMENTSDIPCACWLTNASVGSGWYDAAISNAALTCLLRKRLRFWGPNAAGNSAAQGQSVMLFLDPNYADAGRVEAGFVQHFGRFGWVGKKAA